MMNSYYKLIVGVQPRQQLYSPQILLSLTTKHPTTIFFRVRKNTGIRSLYLFQDLFSPLTASADTRYETQVQSQNMMANSALTYRLYRGQNHRLATSD